MLKLLVYTPLYMFWYQYCVNNSRPVIVVIFDRWLVIIGDLTKGFVWILCKTTKNNKKISVAISSCKPYILNTDFFSESLQLTWCICSIEKEQNGKVCEKKSIFASIIEAEYSCKGTFTNSKLRSSLFKYTEQDAWLCKFWLFSWKIHWSHLSKA